MLFMLSAVILNAIMMCHVPKAILEAHLFYFLNEGVSRICFQKVISRLLKFKLETLTLTRNSQKAGLLFLIAMTLMYSMKQDRLGRL
jgi:hypothetical protein